ncbi:hypothetical protein PIB30_112507, partial [Stylosanthes scabra]|nr:hypothetical protein [Stylosanthes scabra]
MNYGVKVTTPIEDLKNPQNKDKEGEVVTKMDAVKKRKNTFSDLHSQLDVVKKKKNHLPTTVE